MNIEPVCWENGELILIDQTVLPTQRIDIRYTDPEKVALAIETMIVRGAPAIGVTAAFGLVLAAKKFQSLLLAQAQKEWTSWCERFSKTRPTAVNLFWAIDQMKTESKNFSGSQTQDWISCLEKKAILIKAQDIAACKSMGDHGAKLLPDKCNVLTHCNAGALATAGWGSALGVIRSAVAMGKDISVWVDETRPFLQGSRLTAWELAEENIKATLITDNMAGFFMSKGEVDAVIVGADRIAANGDVANKIGTYTVAVLAKEHGIPFYVAAPLSTIDLKCPTGSQIPIEERDPQEVKEFRGIQVAPEKVSARHPAFDVTPNHLVTAIFTQKGVCKAPYTKSIANLFA